MGRGKKEQKIRNTEEVKIRNTPEEVLGKRAQACSDNSLVVFGTGILASIALVSRNEKMPKTGESWEVNVRGEGEESSCSAVFVLVSLQMSSDGTPILKAATFCDTSALAGS